MDRGILVTVFFAVVLVLSALFYSGSLTGRFMGDSGGYGIPTENETQEKTFGRETTYRVNYSDVVDFVMEDGTYLNNYSEDYVCQDFANDVVGNALGEGIGACTVFIDHEKGSHSIVAFDTADQGVVFLEPQTGEFAVEPTEGEDYCDLVGWNCTWRIREIKHCFK